MVWTVLKKQARIESQVTGPINFCKKLSLGLGFFMSFFIQGDK